MVGEGLGRSIEPNCARATHCDVSGINCCLVVPSDVSCLHDVCSFYLAEDAVFVPCYLSSDDWAGGRPGSRQCFFRIVYGVEM